VLRGRWVLDNLLDAPPPETSCRRAESQGVGNRHDRVDARTTRSCTARIRHAPRAIGEWIRSDSASRTSMRWAPGARWTASSPSTRRERCRWADVQRPEELRNILRADHQAFEHCLTAKLLTYALGRGLERYDKRTVSGIVSRLPERQYRFSGLILEIVNSLPFQSRRGASTASTTP